MSNEFQMVEQQKIKTGAESLLNSHLTFNAKDVQMSQQYDKEPSYIYSDKKEKKVSASDMDQ